MSRADDVWRSVDDTLVLALSGCAAAWNALYRALNPLIHSSVIAVNRYMSIGLSVSDVEDCVSETWLRLAKDDWKKLRRYRPKGGRSLRSWVRLIARQTLADMLRQRRRNKELPMSDELENQLCVPEGLRPECIIWRRQRLSLATRALERLKRPERAFFKQLVVLQHNPVRVAKEFGVNIKTVYSRKFKLRRKIQIIAERLQAVPA